MKLFKGFITIFTYVAGLIFIALINSLYDVNNQGILILENILLLLFLGYKYIDDIKSDYKNFKEPRKIIFRNLKYYIICFVLMLISNLILTKCLGDIASNEKLNRILLREKPIYAFMSLILITPICEEIVFRLSFKDSSKNEKIKIFITALTFALVHILLSFKNAYSFIYIIPYFFLGLAFGLIYFKEKNIFASMLFHSFHNAFSIIVIILSSGKL